MSRQQDGDVKLLAISGSLRQASTSSAVLRAAADAAPTGVVVELYAGLRDLPHFDPDLEAELPEEARSFLEACEQADGVLLCVPEYAHGIPGSFKNALDWTVRRGSLYRKPLTVIKTSPPGRGTYARAALERVLRALDADATFAAVPAPVIDAETTAQLGAVAAELAERASRRRHADNLDV